MDAAEFEERVVERIEPIARPRGFPYDPQPPSSGSVLFHCQGSDLQRVRERWPGWFREILSGYGDPADEITCLDLWVEHVEDGRYATNGWQWSFEASSSEVGRVVGDDEIARLEALATGDLELWLGRLAHVFERYFAAIEAGESARRS